VGRRVCGGLKIKGGFLQADALLYSAFLGFLQPNVYNTRLLGGQKIAAFQWQQRKKE
jgi:hypothetical protein